MSIGSKDQSNVRYPSQVVTANKQINTKANTVTFLNYGTQACMIDGTTVLAAGMGCIYKGYPGDVSVHTFELTFADQNSQGISVTVVQKIY